MVATQFARGRAVAAAIVAIFLFAIVPVTPVQAQGAGDVSIEQGAAHWRQSNFFAGSVNTSFVDNGTATTLLRVPVRNIGTELANVPVYYWINEAPDRVGCRKVTLPQGTATEPGIAVAQFDVPTRPLAPGAYNVTIVTFPAERPTQVPAEWECDGTVARPLPGCVGLSCRAEADAENNRVTAYLVKERYLDLKITGIRWCEGPSDDPEQICDDDMLHPNEAVYNITPIYEPDDEEYQPNYTFFEVIVENVADKDHSWANYSNYGGACDTRTGCVGTGFEYHLNVTVTGPYIDGVMNLSQFVETTDRHATDTLEHRPWSTSFELDRKAGPYNVTVKLDPQRHLRRHAGDTVADTDWYRDPTGRELEVAYRDFTGNFSAPGTSGAFAGGTPETAYDYEAYFEIEGNITFANKGPAGRAGVAVGFKVYLDNITWVDAANQTHYNRRFHRNVTYAPADNFSDWVYELTWPASSTPDSDFYLPPGRHTIHVQADYGEALLEYNESNNNFSFDIYVKDDTKPRFNGTPSIALARANAAPQQVYRPHEAFNVRADLVDDDNLLNVTVNFTLDSNDSVYRVYNLTKAASALLPDRYVATVFDFKFHNFTAVPVDGSENWTAVIVARDSFDNNVTSAPLPFRLKAWPIHNATADHVIVMPEAFPDANHSWNAGPDPEWVIRVEPNMTGFSSRDDHQQFKTSNLAYNITVLATGVTFDLNSTYWQYRTPTDPATSTPDNPQPLPGCNPFPRQNDGVGGNLGENVPGGTPSACDQNLNNTFRAQFPRNEVGAAPGIWNYSIRVTDIAGYVRIINGTLDLEDFQPEIVAWNLSDTTTVVPPGTVVVQAELTDDNNEIAGAYLNLTRTSPGDGHVVNISLTQRNENASGGVTRFVYNETIDIKRGAPNAIGIGGVFNATLHVVDDVGNWNKTGLPDTFTIVDEEAPQLVGFGAIPSVVEVGENLTFWANASDLTNVTMRLEIFRAVGSSELLMDPILIPQPTGSGPWNYTHELNFTLEAVHSYRITAIDSTGRASTPGSGTITVRDNLGPKYDVVSPSFTVDGDRYGSGTPRIEVIVRDVEGVVGSSIEMEVAGLPVDFDLLPAPSNINGYLVSYTVPAARKFNHRDVVEVNLSATDSSSESLVSFFNFSFIVDDVSPTARLVSVSPSYRDQPAHVLNVSLSSRITLAAEDIDGLPTGIPAGGIRYRILGGGPSAETVYSGPFRITDAPGVYTGPRLYQIQFWAEDDVGNFDRQFNVTTVYVDDTPPALFQFFPQGRNINATFVDDRVGVNRSVVWYRLNDQAYTPLPLVEREGTWSITLPEGVKGDRISYYLQAWDRLDNTETFGNATNPYASFDVSNHEPRVRIVTPVDGGRVSRTVELRWEASDEDGDALVFTVYYRAPGRTNFVELAKLENTDARRYNIDTTRFPDGEYTFRVAAGDGGFVKLAETTVTVLNSAGAIGSVRVSGDAVPGGTMLVTAEVTKAEATVEARLYQGSTLVGSYPMNDEGREGDVTAGDHVFSARVPVSAAGDYRVEIFTQYREDGVLKESSLSPNSAAFSANLTPGYILSEYGAVIALIGLLGAVGIGVAVFVVMRRR